MASVTDVPGAELLCGSTPAALATTTNTTATITAAAVTALARAVLAPAARPPRSSVHIGTVDVLSSIARAELVAIVDAAWAKGDAFGVDRAYAEATAVVSGTSQN